MKRIIHLIITSLVVENASADQPMPPDVQRIIEQRASASSKIDRIYVQELEKLKSSYTKQGNLEVALKIDHLLDDVIKNSTYSNSVFLDDLKEEDVKIYRDIGIGKHGRKSAEVQDTFTFDQRIPEHSLFTHPQADGIASVTYRLSGNHTKFTGTVGIADGARPHTAMTFRVLDGQAIIWESKSISDSYRSQEFEINVKGRIKITLQVKSHGSTGEAHAVWINPKLQK